MKSLEIVNSWALDVHEKRLKLVSCGGSKEDIVLSSQIDKLLRIRQDLEILEIISKKNVRIGEIKYYLKELKEGIAISITKIEDVLIVYNKGVTLEDELTMEELLKLKKWLEGNEDE